MTTDKARELVEARGEAERLARLEDNVHRACVKHECMGGETTLDAFLALMDKLDAAEREAKIQSEAADKAIEACVAAERERDALRAARYAYATEFPPGAGGVPDVGSVHENIRAMKRERDALRGVVEDARRKALKAEWYADNQREKLASELRAVVEALDRAALAAAHAESEGEGER